MPIITNMKRITFFREDNKHCFFEAFPIIPSYYEDTKFLACIEEPWPDVATYLLVPTAGVGFIYDPYNPDYKPSAYVTTYCEDYPFVQKDSYSELLEWYMRDYIKEEHKTLSGMPPSEYSILLSGVINEIAELTEFYVGVLRARK